MSPHGLRSQSSTDWTNLLSHSAVIQTRNHSNLPSKGSVLGRPSSVLSSQSLAIKSWTVAITRPSSQSAWPPPHGPPRITGRENLFQPAKLEENHCRPMGAGSSSGVQVRADEPAGAVAHTIFRDGQEVCRPHCGTGRIDVGQEGHTMHSTRPNRKFLFPIFPVPKNSGQL